MACVPPTCSLLLCGWSGALALAAIGHMDVVAGPVELRGARSAPALSSDDG
jgi:hypothetical protein